jgi:arylformamidase
VKVQCLSHILSLDTPLYGGAKNIQIEQTSKISDGRSCNSFHLVFGNHTSTHIDLPFHFVNDGKKLNDFSPDFWVYRNAVLIELTVNPGELIEWSDLAAQGISNSDQIELLLIRTGFEQYRSQKTYWTDGPGLSKSWAVPLRRTFPKLRAIGVDFLSITSYKHREEGRLAHQALLKQDIALIEDMKLSEFKFQPTLTVVAPLLVEGIDGAPVTVFCIYDEANV